MAHLTIYLSAEIEKRVRKAAKASHTSVGKWVAELGGTFPEFPAAKDLRKGYGKHIARETFD